jgi:cation diffusion facilitator CzcD-associated flavoprotein CzcO
MVPCSRRRSGADSPQLPGIAGHHRESTGLRPNIVIVGAGFAGICIGIVLKRAGIDSFTIVERAERLGGIWRDHACPGTACSLPSLSHCFSFEPKSDWREPTPARAEILDYLEHCARRYELLPHIRFGAGIASACFDAEGNVWRLTDERGDALTADFLILAAGRTREANVPAISGLATFGSTCIDAAQLAADCSADGLRVGVIGQGPSLLRVVPQLAASARELHLFLTDRDWILPGSPLTDPERTARLGHAPGFARLTRWLTWLDNEAQCAPLLRNRLWAGFTRRRALAHLSRQIPEETLRHQLLPNSRIGERPVLRSDTFYPSLRQPHVHVHEEAVGRVVPAGLVKADGRPLLLDMLVVAREDLRAELPPMPVVGMHGRSLNELWRDRACAYLGLTVAAFPNLFIMGGPDTHVDHNSAIFMLECQAGYIARCLHRMQRLGLRRITVRQEACDRFLRAVDRQRDQLAAKRDGNWPWSTARYWWKTLEADFSDYEWQ